MGETKKAQFWAYGLGCTSKYAMFPINMGMSSFAERASIIFRVGSYPTTGIDGGVAASGQRIKSTFALESASVSPIITSKFSFAFAPFRVLQHCQSVEEMNRFVNSTKNNLTENGRFVFDLFNPWIHMLVREGVVFDGNYHDKEGNLINRRVEINKRDYFKQTQNIEEYYTVRYTDGKTDKFEWLYTTGYFFKDTASMVLEKNDLSVENLYGHFDRTPFGKGEYPGELIFDCLKKRKER